MSTHRMGQGMIIAASVICLGMLTLFFAEVQERQYNPNQAPLSTTMADAAVVELKQNRQGHYVVTGNINRQEVQFLLDTGATDVVIGQRLAQRLGLREGLAARAMTANGAVTVYQTNIDELSIGAITLYNVRASINPAMFSDAILLGMSALKQVEFVQRGDSLTLRQLY